MSKVHLEKGVTSKNIAIVGAGPSGVLAGIALAKKGANVTVFEKRTREEAVGGNGRSFSLTLSSRGCKVLQEQGIWEEIESVTVPVSGRMCHSGMQQHSSEYSADGSLVLYAVKRSTINEKLLSMAESIPSVTVLYKHTLEEIVETSGTVLMRDMTDQSVRFYNGFDLIIGADGGNSKTREYLHQSKVVSSSQVYLEWGYREVVLPAESNLEPGYLHLWPREEMMMFALPNKDGTFGANFIFPLKEDNRIFQLEKLVLLLKEQFPNLSNLSEKIATDLIEKKTSLFFSQQSSLWHSNDKTVLIGDAAHSTVPFYGQGLNCAFEGVSKLVAMLENEWGTKPLPNIMEEYQRLRKPHTDRIADLSMENFDELRSNFGNLDPQAERMAEVLFHKFAPNVFSPLHILISHGELGYLDAESEYNRQKRLARWLGLGVLKQACGYWISTCNFYQRHPYFSRPY